MTRDLSIGDVLKMQQVFYACETLSDRKTFLAYLRDEEVLALLMQMRSDLDATHDPDNEPVSHLYEECYEHVLERMSG